MPDRGASGMDWLGLKGWAGWVKSPLRAIERQRLRVEVCRLMRRRPRQRRRPEVTRVLRIICQLLECHVVVKDAIGAVLGAMEGLRLRWPEKDPSGNVSAQTRSSDP